MHVAQETLGLRRQGLSPCLSLLMSAFALPIPPARVTPHLRRPTERSPTTQTLPSTHFTLQTHPRPTPTKRHAARASNRRATYLPWQTGLGCNDRRSRNAARHSKCAQVERLNPRFRCLA